MKTALNWEILKSYFELFNMVPRFLELRNKYGGVIKRPAFTAT